MTDNFNMRLNGMSGISGMVVTCSEASTSDKAYCLISLPFGIFTSFDI